MVKFPELNIILATIFLSFALYDDGPQDCVWVTNSESSTSKMQLSCNVRFIHVDLRRTNFSAVNSETTTNLKIKCISPIIIESSLTSRTFQKLQLLEELIIEFCTIRQVPQGTFEELRELKKLEIRTFNSKDSNVALQLQPGSFSGLKELQSLDLSNNKIWTLPARVFCSLLNLQNLNISNNNLQEIVDLSFNLEGSEDENGVSVECYLDLKTLDLSLNTLTAMPDLALSKLRRLENLYLDQNEISSVSDKALVGLNSLLSLNMSNNRIVALPQNLFQSCTNLQELDLHNNSVGGLAPGLLSQLDQLLVLDLSFNNLNSVWITQDTFVGLIRLIVLNLANNKIARLETLMFRDLYSLQILNLKSNFIESVDDNVFLPLHNLHTLVLSHNNLMHIDSLLFNGLFVLSKLFLNNNVISSFHPQAFRNCSNLQELSLNGNALLDVPQALRELSFLKNLDLGENRISDLQNDSFLNLQQLNGLRLVDNHLTRLRKGMFSEITTLQNLNLAKNKIQHIEQGTFEKNDNLQAIRLDANFLTDINAVFSTLPKLKWLNLSDNHLQWFDYAFIPKSLEWIDIHKNYVEELGNHFNIEDGLVLKTLDASFNKLKEICAASVPNSLELLLVNNNQIHKVGTNTFFDKENLTRVDLYSNDLRELELSALGLMPVPENKSLPEVYIGDNPFYCDCKMDWLVRINHMGNRQHPRVMDLENVMCKMTYTWGQPYLSLTEATQSDFLCIYEAHCFALCHCCDFDACDCEMTCPRNCTCYHDDAWTTNIVDCTGLDTDKIPLIPMDATHVHLDGNRLKVLKNHVFIGRKNMKVLFVNRSDVEMVYNRTFHGLNTLEVLHLEDNKLRELRGFEFEHLFHLKELYLQNNRISFIANVTMAPLRSLQVLHLEGNRLLTFPVWHLTLNSHLVEVTLADNLWTCQCKFVRELSTWLQDNEGKVRDKSRIRCYFKNAGILLSESNSTCGSSITGFGFRGIVGTDYYPMLIMSLSALAIVAAVSVLLFVYRHDVRVWLYTRFGIRLFYATPASDTDKLYDAYVCYSPKDEEFVAHTISAELENGNPSYRIYLQHRDLPEVTQNPCEEEAAKSSRRLILVLTRNFLQTEWSRFDFRSIVHESLKGRKGRLIIVLEGDLKDIELDADMKLYLKTSARIRWGEKRFWEKLRYALPSEQNFQKNLRHYSKDGACSVKLELKKDDPRVWSNYVSNNSAPPLPPPRNESSYPVRSLRYPHTYSGIDPDDTEHIYTAVHPHSKPATAVAASSDDTWGGKQSGGDARGEGQLYLV